MSKAVKFWGFGLLSGILVALAVVLILEGCRKKVVPPTGITRTGLFDKQVEEIKTGGGRLHNKVVKGTIEMTGRGTDAKRGYSREANFKYTLFVAYKSEIKEQSASDGKVIVEEIRTFENVSDNLVISNAKIKVAIYETLPVKKFLKVVDIGTAALSLFPPARPFAKAVAKTAHITDTVLQKVDGTDLTKLWGITPDIGEKELFEGIKNLGGDTRAIGCVRSLSGKSYKITYYLGKNKAPILVTATYADGRKIEDKDEQLVLNRVNAFVDYHVLPDTDCKPGASWDVKAGDMQELFDPFVEGNYSGSVRVTRGADQDGCWSLEMAPAEIAMISGDGQSIGSLSLERGTALVDPANYHIKEMRGSGRVNVRKKSKQHLVCTMTISGDCEFHGRLVMIDLPKK